MSKPLANDHMVESIQNGIKFVNVMWARFVYYYIISFDNESKL